MKERTRGQLPTTVGGGVFWAGCKTPGDSDLKTLQPCTGHALGFPSGWNGTKYTGVRGAWTFVFFPNSSSQTYNQPIEITSWFWTGMLQASAIKFTRIRPLTFLWCPWITERLSWKEFTHVHVLLWPSVVVHVLRLLRLPATLGLTWSSGQNACGWDTGRKRDIFWLRTYCNFSLWGNEVQGPFSIT